MDTVRSPPAVPSSSPQRRRVRAAVVGAGRIAEQHLPYLAASPAVELVGVCDRDPTLAAYMARKHGGSPFTDLDALLSEAAPEVLHVLTPPRLHVGMGRAALDAGAHVFVEKPMALDAPGREDLLQRATAAGRLVLEDHNYRFNRPMLRLQDAVAAGQVGRLVDVDVAVTMPLGSGSRYGDRNLPSPSHQLPAGFIHEFITHMAYLAVALLPGGELTEARWAKRVADHPSPHDDLDARLVDGDVAGRLRFTALGPRSRIAVTAVGTEGSAEAEMIFGSFRIDRPRAVGPQLSPAANAVAGGLASARRGVGYVADRLRGRTAYEGLHELLARTYRCVRDGGAPPIRAIDMRRTGDLVDRLIATMP